ncbi:hypothetical protein [Mesorhizobium sp. B2-3-4]|uniref:hypothetical protein n=1 Tax=Mesorhizobium sp. B2-3-4 TaxID=2589959 RepID=UPI00112A8180|nr:hypothetical protein [Mesorhizobium sp. B2-3-4]TPM41841.1 hypothetical protein FJ967_02620 [Mesorhizobium sp. B2-3-4]
MSEKKTFGFWAANYLCGVMLGLAVSAAYIGLEQPVYYWDFAAYFNTFNQQGALLVEEPFTWLSQLGTSIAMQDYGVAILVPLMPFQIVFGGSRLSFIAAIVSVYLVPVALFVSRISYLEAVSRVPSRGWPAVWIAAFLYTPFWAPTLRGLPDIAGCLVLTAATYLLWKSQFLTREPVASGIAVGASLWLAFMLRRWYAYAAIGVTLSAAMLGLLRIARDRDLPAFRMAVVGGLCAIFVIGATALNFQLPLIARVLGTNYGDLYNGYRTNFVTQIGDMGDRLSFLNWLLIIVGLCISIVRRNGFSLLCAIASVLTFLIFTRTQDPDRHHSLPIFLWLFPAYAQAVVAIVSVPALKSPWPTGGIAVAAGLAFLGTFFPAGRQLLSPAEFVFARQATLPLHLDNLAEYRRLIGDLIGRLAPEDRFSVFASGGVMSDALLLGMDRRLAPHIGWICQVDSRDRFQPGVLKSRFVIVTDPPVTHLQPGAQICVTIPNQHIVEGQGIGAAYKRIARYQLSGGVTGYLYEQMRPVTLPELDALYGEFRKKYPDWATPAW